MKWKQINNNTIQSHVAYHFLLDMQHNYNNKSKFALQLYRYTDIRNRILLVFDLTR